MWVLLTAVSGWACSVVGPELHALDPASTDAVAPSAPDLAIDGITRGYREIVLPETCETIGGCEGTAWLSLAVSATDDEAAAEDLGWRIELEGDAPALDVGADAVRARDGVITLHWADEETNDQEPVAFTIRVFAVDLAGNEGPPAEIAVDHPGGPPPVPPECADAEGSKADGGCTVTGGAAAGAWWVAALLALAPRRNA